ncbi:MAG: hypothetical protein CVT88_04585 [Candidatus Altiarchaeales archaeon HGW-Altiarchaeales-1]|nr:MAG: hypothetical protein CVT88_04585 [Candidatus Altiarchaeales archaeon HGW-Altiarchaeales-1]
MTKVNRNKRLSEDPDDEKNSERGVLLLLISTIFIVCGIGLIVISKYYNFPLLDSIGSTSIGAGLIGIIYDVIVRKESMKDLRKELVNIIDDWGYINKLNEHEKERAILKFFETYTTPELAKGCWENFIHPMFQQKEKMIREDFSHEVTIKRLNESKLAKISIKIRYVEKNEDTKAYNLFENVQPVFAINSDPKNFSYSKEQGRCIYMFSSTTELRDLYKKYNIEINEINSHANIENLKKIFNVRINIGNEEWSIDNGKIKPIKIDEQAMVYELTDKNMVVPSGEERVVHINIEFINKILRTYDVYIREVSKNVKINIVYESEFDCRKITPYPYFNVAPTDAENNKKTYVHFSSDINSSQVSFDGWIFPLSGVLFTLFEEEKIRKKVK